MTLKFLALQEAPYIYDISKLRVKVLWQPHIVTYQFSLAYTRVVPTHRALAVNILFHDVRLSFNLTVTLPVFRQRC
jgi:hypothetical protein